MGQSVLSEVFIRLVALFTGPADRACWLGDADVAVPAPEPEQANSSRNEVGIGERLRETGNLPIDCADVLPVCPLVQDVLKHVAGVARHMTRRGLKTRANIQEPDEVHREADADEPMLVEQRNDVVRLVSECGLDHARRPFFQRERRDVLPRDDTLADIVRFSRESAALDAASELLLAQPEQARDICIRIGRLSPGKQVDDACTIGIGRSALQDTCSYLGLA